MDKVTVAVGDIHGCLEEFEELLKKIQYNKEQMRLVLLGDLMDRGPDPVGCIRKARELGVECVMGNHEEKHLRWHKHEKKRLDTGKPNPMRPLSEVDRKANESLSDQDWTWMKSLPLKLDLGLNWWAVHAGCEPRFSLHNQNPSQIIRVRYVNQNGVAQALNPDKSQPENTVYWTEQWKGPENIIYGHCVHDLKECRYDHNSDIQCIGIDTGCCFGGHLTAALMQNSFTGPYYGLAENETVTHDFYKIATVQVKAKQKYFEGYGDE